MKKWLVLGVIGIWLLCGCQVAADYKSAANDPQAVEIMKHNQTDLYNAIIALEPYFGPLAAPFAIGAGALVSIITGIKIGRQKRKQRYTDPKEV